MSICWTTSIFKRGRKVKDPEVLSNIQHSMEHTYIWTVEKRPDPPRGKKKKEILALLNMQLTDIYYK